MKKEFIIKEIIDKNKIYIDLLKKSFFYIILIF